MKLFDKPILAIETSCDETSASVVVGRKILSNVVASQIKLHEKWGGVVPEAAARAHLEAIVPVLTDAVTSAGLGFADLGAIAVTNRPGLIAALSVGLTAAKGLSYQLGIPLIGIHHLEGHLLSILATEIELDALFPHLSLIVSGGHTELVWASSPGHYQILGQTLDDAAGEAFDKGARLMGLGYPGGLAVQQSATDGNPKRYSLPQGLSGPTTDFSFSGLKTAVLRLVEREGENLSVPDACASLQNVIATVLTERTLRAADHQGASIVSLVGGVSANLELRERMQSACERAGIRLLFPPLSLCTDNAAMIGLAASWRLAEGQQDRLDLDCFAQDDL